MSYIVAIETANPPHRHSQAALADFYCGSLNGNDPDGSIARKIKVLAKKSGIIERYSVLSDFSDAEENRVFFPGGHSGAPLPGLNSRMELFRGKALALALESVRKIRGFDEKRERFTHLITVTCTGLFAPGLEIDLITSLGLKNDIYRSSVNFMGCNAAMLALRQAADICGARPGAMVLVVCTELCSIHFQQDYTEDYLLSNLLFGDGAGAMVVTSGSAVFHEGYRRLRIKGFHSLLIPEGREAMGWRLSERGFIMRLSPEVSGLICAGILRLFKNANVGMVDHWAIHPGGKRILDDLCSTLSLDASQLCSSYATLEAFGNMSSATVIYVLNHLLATNTMAKGETIFTAAFGPGLTIESAVLQNV